MRVAGEGVCSRTVSVGSGRGMEVRAGGRRNAGFCGENETVMADSAREYGARRSGVGVWCRQGARDGSRGEGVPLLQEGNSRRYKEETAYWEGRRPWRCEEGRPRIVKQMGERTLGV